jgi:hypothetical protein
MLGAPKGKTDASDSSNSSQASKREPRRGRLQASSSGGALMDQTRHRRGLQGPLRERELRNRNKSYSGHTSPPQPYSARHGGKFATQASDPSHNAVAMAMAATAT